NPSANPTSSPPYLILILEKPIPVSTTLGYQFLFLVELAHPNPAPQLVASAQGLFKPPRTTASTTWAREIPAFSVTTAPSIQERADYFICCGIIGTAKSCGSTCGFATGGKPGPNGVSEPARISANVLFR